MQFNDYDIERFSKPQSNDIDPRKVDVIADDFVKRFGSPESRNFYCFAAYKLKQDTLNRLAAQAEEKGRYPGRLFNYLVRAELGQLPAQQTHDVPEEYRV